MYNRINGSSSFPWTGLSDADELTRSDIRGTQPDTKDRSFEDAFSGMQIAESGSYASSSSSASRPYFLASRPPVEEISPSSFADKLEEFRGEDIEHIAANPQRYSRELSRKAERAMDVVHNHGTSGSDHARYYSYQLGEKCVGLLRTEPGGPLSEIFKGHNWQKTIPGRTDATSTVDFRVTHPLVENAGDILLEHQLRRDGDRPLLLSHPVNNEAKARAKALGFIEVGDSMMVLDPTRSDKWTNSSGEWQRANKPPLYLSKVQETDGRQAEGSLPAVNTTPDWEDDDFM
ncbi:Effector protein NopP [Bradyrhizobium sp. STM 3562]|uniref:Effector protein NopP n=1 Tax=Bradyrhizobium sp. STM 3562 TaxID=578924 RepID=UPI00388FC855